MQIKHKKYIPGATTPDPNKLQRQDWNDDHEIIGFVHDHTSEEQGGVVVGLPGPKGDKGDPGERGLQGDPGSDGLPGAKGDTGDTGPAGADSTVPGPKGDKGDTGDPGYTPVKGIDYFDGAPGEQGIQGIQGIQGEPGPSGPASHMEIPVHADASANLTLTNQANSEQDLGNNVRSRKKVDLSWCTAFRVIGRLVTGSASANNPRIYFRYSTNDSNYYAMDAVDTAVSMTATGWKDTGWLDLVAGAKADNVYIRICQNGGDAAADPAWGNIHWIFK